MPRQPTQHHGRLDTLPSVQTANGQKMDRLIELESVEREREREREKGETVRTGIDFAPGVADDRPGFWQVVL